MNVDIILYAGAVTPERVSGHAVAVIDAFRATSVMVEAMHNGAQAVIPLVTVEDAFAMCEKFGRGQSVLGGERGMVKVEGFDLGNSPAGYTREAVAGKKVVFTTTNGTRAIHNSRFAAKLYVAAFLNMSAVCRALAASGKDAVLVCSGRQDRFTAEDGLCAGAMAGILSREYGYGLTDIADVMRRMYDDASGDLRGRLSSTLHYNAMLEKGLSDDIEFCLRKDIYDIAPHYDARGEITV